MKNQSFQLVEMTDQPLFTKLARRPAVDVDFEDLSFSASGKVILNGISGEFKSGALNAIVGPSGAGKSTLMSILAGYMNSGVKGCIRMNGEPRRMKVFGKLSSYIMQEDHLEPFVTVREAMTFAAHLKLGHELSPEDKQFAIEEILTMLGLSKCREVFTDRLSGGERKRMSIAVELVNNPPVIFLDEPTTGLDIVTMRQCMDLLKILAKQGRTIICTIHQPSATVFESLDSIYVLTQGKCVYQGAPTELVPFLSSVSLHCPDTYNPADYILEILNNETINILSEVIQNGKVNKISSKHQAGKSSSLLYRKDTCGKLAPDAIITGIDFPTSFWQQFKLLIGIMALQKIRNKTGFWLQVLHHVVSAFFVGAVFFGVGNNASRPVENFKFCICLCVFYMFTHCMIPVLLFPHDLKIMKREFFNRWYSLKAFYAAKSVSTMPAMLVLGWFYAVATYYVTDQPMELRRFAWFSVIASLMALTSEGLGMAIGFTFNCKNGAMVCSSMMTPILMLSIQGLGYGQHISTFTLWIMKLSYLRFALVGLITALYLDGRVMECDKDDIYCFYKDPSLLVRDLAMTQYRPETSIFGLIFYLIAFRLLAFISLRFRVSTDFSFRVFSYINKIVKIR